MRELTIGPCKPSSNGEEHFANIPIQTQGDWKKTLEGYEAMDAAQSTIYEQVKQGNLPETSVFDWLDDDRAIFRITCNSHAEVQETIQKMKGILPKMLNAGLVNPISMHK